MDIKKIISTVVSLFILYITKDWYSYCMYGNETIVLEKDVNTNKEKDVNTKKEKDVNLLKYKISIDEDDENKNDTDEKENDTIMKKVTNEKENDTIMKKLNNYFVYFWGDKNSNRQNDNNNNIQTANEVSSREIEQSYYMSEGFKDFQESIRLEDNCIVLKNIKGIYKVREMRDDFGRIIEQEWAEGIKDIKLEPNAKYTSRVTLWGEPFGFYYNSKEQTVSLNGQILIRNISTEKHSWEWDKSMLHDLTYFLIETPKKETWT